MSTKPKKKKKNGSRAVMIFLLVCLLAALTVVIRHRDALINSEPEQVEVYNGAKSVWIRPEADVPVNDLTKEDFELGSDGLPRYIGSAYEVSLGVDVSSHQREIDWQQVKDSGVEFAVLRIGGRYYGGDGELYTDELFAANFEGAKNAGLRIGVYFFSQAISAEEAREEADTVIALLDGAELQLPVYFDWERVADDDGRANYVGNETMTQCAIAFCERIENAGYEAGVYFNLDTSYYGYTMKHLTDYSFWCAAPGEYPYCYYASELWQYSFEGSVPGIGTACDLDMMFVRK